LRAKRGMGERAVNLGDEKWRELGIGSGGRGCPKSPRGREQPHRTSEDVQTRDRLGRDGGRGRLRAPGALCDSQPAEGDQKQGGYLADRRHAQGQVQRTEENDLEQRQQRAISPLAATGGDAAQAGQRQGQGQARECCAPRRQSQKAQRKEEHREAASRVERGRRAAKRPRAPQARQRGAQEERCSETRRTPRLAAVVQQQREPEGAAHREQPQSVGAHAASRPRARAVCSACMPDQNR
jgi:hypothetical protein